MERNSTGQQYSWTAILLNNDNVEITGSSSVLVSNSSSNYTVGVLERSNDSTARLADRDTVGVSDGNSLVVVPLMALYLLVAYLSVTYLMVSYIAYWMMSLMDNNTVNGSGGYSLVVIQLVYLIVETAIPLAYWK